MKNLKFLFSYILLLLVFVEASGHTEINYPEGGETFYSGDTVLIKWTELAQHQTQNWELYFSADGGGTWEEISNNIAVPLREFKWAVPFTITVKGKIKVVQNNAGTDYQDFSANFNVEMAQGTNDIPVAPNSFLNYPNPAGTFTVVSFTLVETVPVHLFITDQKGAVVKRLIDGELSEGAHEIRFDVGDLPRGIYFYTLRSGKFIRTRKLLVSG